MCFYNRTFCSVKLTVNSVMIIIYCPKDVVNMCGLICVSAVHSNNNYVFHVVSPCIKAKQDNFPGCGPPFKRAKETAFQVVDFRTCVRANEAAMHVRSR